MGPARPPGSDPIHAIDAMHSRTHTHHTYKYIHIHVHVHSSVGSLSVSQLVGPFIQTHPHRTNTAGTDTQTRQHIHTLSRGGG